MSKKTLLEARKTRAMEGLEIKVNQLLIQQARILELLEGKPKKAGKGEKPVDPDEAKPEGEPEKQDADKAGPENSESGEEK